MTAKLARDYRCAAARVPDEELVMMILARIAEGEDLIKILKEDGMPAVNTFHRWLARYPEWRKGYREALEIKMHGLVEETVQIADECDPRAVKKAELRVKARQWAAERLGRNDYGDPRVATTITGPVTINHNSIHALLTKGTEMPNLIDITGENQHATGQSQMEPAEVGGRSTQNPDPAVSPARPGEDFRAPDHPEQGDDRK